MTASRRVVAKLLTVMSKMDYRLKQPGLKKMGTSVHFLCDSVLSTLLHVSPQFQRETKTQVQYVKPGMFLLRRYRYILLCFYYVDIDTYCCVYIT